MVKQLLLIWVAAAMLLFVPSHPVNAQSAQMEKVDVATAVLQEIMASPDTGIPEALLRNAAGVAVIPGVLKAGFGIGGRYGEGILVSRTQDGGWSNPVFVRITGGSFGWQIGAQSTDLILVFKTQRSLDNINRGKFTLGLDASVAAGPVGRNASASTDLQLRAEIFSYSRSRGLFAGAAIDGAVLAVNHKANDRFYGKQGVTMRDIFMARTTAPPVAHRFTCLLARYTHAPAQACA